MASSIHHTLRDVSIAYPRGFVLAAGDEVGAVGAELQVRDDVHVRALVREHLLARLRVKQCDLARLVAHDEEVRRVREGAQRRLRADGVEHDLRLF